MCHMRRKVGMDSQEKGRIWEGQHGRQINTPQKVHVLISRTYEYVRLHREEELGLQIE